MVVGRLCINDLMPGATTPDTCQRKPMANDATDSDSIEARKHEHGPRGDWVDQRFIESGEYLY
jgi:hypothetical protein